MIAITSGEIVQIPPGKLGREPAEVLDSLIEKVFLLVFVVAALLLAARFVRQALRLQRIMRS